MKRSWSLSSSPTSSEAETEEYNNNSNNAEEEEEQLQVTNSSSSSSTNECYESKQKKAKYDDFIINNKELKSTFHEEDNHHSNNNNNTRVILIDLMETFNHHHQHQLLLNTNPNNNNNNLIQMMNNNNSEDEIKSLFNKLKKKMNSNECVEHAFSTNFDYSSIIIGMENEEEEKFTFLYPYDVKICYNLKLVFVSGTDESKLVVYSLNDYKFLTTIELETMPTNLCIEEWDRNSNDIIISGNNTHLYKYNLEQCLKAKPKPLWICDKVNSPNGIISVMDRNNSNENYRKETALLYVCDMFSEMIGIVQSQTGQFIGNINLLSEAINISCPWSIGVNNLGQFIISGLQNSSKHIIEIIERQYDQKTKQPEWKSIKVIENEQDKLKYPFGLVVDSVSSNIIVCDSLNHRIMVFKQDGSMLKVYGTKGRENFQLSTPMGLCINKMNGELLVSDSENHRILCYK